MKRLLIVTACLLLLSPSLLAQDVADAFGDPGAPASQAPGPCGTLGVWGLRGTYALTGSAWQDLSELNPALPKGYAPVSIIGAFKVSGNGDLTGWASVNAGGVQMTAEFVNSRVGAPRADCGFPVTLSMKIKEYGGMVSGPYSYAGVVAGHGAALEIALMMLGTGPGSHVEMDRARRISMNFH